LTHRLRRAGTELGLFEPAAYEALFQVRAVAIIDGALFTVSDGRSWYRATVSALGPEAEVATMASVRRG
jgi:hypothetical protein